MANAATGDADVDGKTIYRARDREAQEGGQGVADAREQQTLGRLCRRLRQGDVVKFVKDVRVVDRDWLR
jgi:hypothetical protein